MEVYEGKILIDFLPSTVSSDHHARNAIKDIAANAYSRGTVDGISVLFRKKGEEKWTETP